MSLNGPPIQNTNESKSTDFYTQTAERARKIFALNKKLENKQKNLQILESTSLKIIDKLSDTLSKISSLDSESELKNKSFLIKENIGTVKLEIKTLGNYLSIDISLPEIEKQLEYGFFILFNYTNNKGIIETNIKYLNVHRDIPIEVRGQGLGREFELIVEKSAQRAGIKKLYFKSGPLNNSALFALTQGYTCVKEEDKENILNLIKHLETHPEKINDGKEIMKSIEFEKII